MLFRRDGFLSALGVSFYILLIGLFINNGEKFIGHISLPLGPILMLLLLSTSVLICAVLAFYKPYKLFINDKKKEAANTVISTTLWLIIFLILFIAGIAIFR